MESKLKILGVAGSLRKGSYHKAVLKAAQKLTPALVALDIFEELDKIPPFNQDSEENPPEIITRFKQQIRGADAILFATPEYNYSIPGVLKNAIDWASRPYGDSAWEGKPAAIISASVGMIGGARAQYHLRQTFVFLNMVPLNKPEVIIPLVTDKFDEDMELTDEHTKEKIEELLNALADWTVKLSTEVSPQRHAEKYPYQNAYDNPMNDIQMGGNN